MEVAYSECACHIRAAGKVFAFRLTEGRYPMVQLLRPDGGPYSAPITTGEAGVYNDTDGFYYYAAPPQRFTLINGYDSAEDHRETHDSLEAAVEAAMGGCDLTADEAAELRSARHWSETDQYGGVTWVRIEAE